MVPRKEQNDGPARRKDSTLGDLVLMVQELETYFTCLFQSDSRLVIHLPEIRHTQLGELFL